MHHCTTTSATSAYSQRCLSQKSPDRDCATHVEHRTPCPVRRSTAISCRRHLAQGPAQPQQHIRTLPLARPPSPGTCVSDPLARPASLPPLPPGTCQTALPKIYSIEWKRGMTRTLTIQCGESIKLRWNNDFSGVVQMTRGGWRVQLRSDSGGVGSTVHLWLCSSACDCNRACRYYVRKQHAAPQAGHTPQALSPRTPPVLIAQPASSRTFLFCHI